MSRGELDKTVSTYINSKVIKTPLVQVSDENLMDFLARHLKRKKKYYAMIEYIQSKFKVVNKTLEHSIEKHKFKVKVRCRGKKSRFGGAEHSSSIIHSVERCLSRLRKRSGG